MHPELEVVAAAYAAATAGLAASASATTSSANTKHSSPSRRADAQDHHGDGIDSSSNASSVAGDDDDRTGDPIARFYDSQWPDGDTSPVTSSSRFPFADGGGNYERVLGPFGYNSSGLPKLRESSSLPPFRDYPSSALNREQQQQHQRVDFHRTTRPAYHAINADSGRRGIGSGGEESDQDDDDGRSFLSRSTSSWRNGREPEPRWVKELRTLARNSPPTPQGTLVNTAFSVALLVSIALLCVGTIPAVAADPYLRAVFFVLNFISILIFSAELAIDCIVFRGPWSALVLEPVFIIDFLAIFPFYLEVLIAIVLGHDIITSVGSVSGLAVLRVLRLFRILRLLKVVERSEKLRLLGTAVLASSDGIAVLFLVSPLLVCFFGTLTFYAEQTDEYFKDGVWYYSDGTVSPFQSIPDCFWLTIVTLTTVGYGDVAPRTTAGRLVSAANALIALIFLAFPLTIITSQYSKLITDAEARAKRKKEKKAAAAKSAAAFTEQVRRGSGVLPPSAPFSVDEAAEILMELDKLRSRLAKIVGRPEDVQF